MRGARYLTCDAPQSSLRRGMLLSISSTLLGGLAGCALPPRTNNAETPFWSGRIALQVEGDTPQSFAALFELEGEESQGQLTLFSPLGTTLGQLRWDAGTATLQTGQQIQRSDSLDALVVQLTGAALPVKAIFHWLKGSQAEAAGWTSDLSAAHQGRITAQRVLPEPKATLRISLSH